MDTSETTIIPPPFPPTSATEAESVPKPARKKRTSRTTAHARKKILFIITKSYWGGAGRHVYDIATSLPKRPFEVIVAVGGEGPLKTRLEEAGVRVVSLPTLERDISLWKDTASFAAIYKLLKDERPDLVHLHSPKAGGLGTLAARLLRIPEIIYTAHGWPFKETRSGWQKNTLLLLSWLTTLLSTTTIVVSDDDKERIEQFPFIRSRLVRIYNGAKSVKYLDRIRAREALLSDRNFWGDGYFWIGTIAELHRNKGLDCGIEAIAELIKEDAPEFRNVSINFVVIGEGEERERLQTKINVLGITDRVFLVGSKQDAASLLRAFDLFLFPSVKEGLPYAILEAGLAKLPVIATNVGGIPEIITDMHSGIVVRPGEPKEIKEAIKFVVANRAHAATFGKELHKKVVMDFSIKEMLEKVVALYTKNTTPPASQETTKAPPEEISPAI